MSTKAKKKAGVTEAKPGEEVQTAPTGPLHVPSKFYVAKERCWVGEDGKTIVADGDKSARVLLANARGQKLTEENITGLTNVDDFLATVSTQISE